MNTAALDTRVKATVTSTMYDMSRVNSKGYFDSEDSEQSRFEKRKALNAQRTANFKSGNYALGGGVVDPLPEDVLFFVKDYYDYYKKAFLQCLLAVERLLSVYEIIPLWEYL